MKTFLASINYLQPQVFTIIITTVIIVTICVIYKIKVSRLRPYESPKGIVLVVERYCGWMEDSVVDVMGTKFRWFTPYAIFLLSYLGIGNLLSLLGLEGISTNYTVVFTLGLVTFFGIYICGVKFQKWGFALKYIKDPTHIITQFSPLISLTFRMFGNLTAGSVILALFYELTSNASIDTGLWINNYGIVNNTTGTSPIFMINILGGILSPPFHFYFDIFDGLIQTYIFTLLTLSYIGQEATGHGPERAHKKVHIRNNKNALINENIDIVRKFN